MTTYNVVSPGAMVAGQAEDISVILANLNAIATVLNGGIDNGNINAAAAIAISKLAGYPSDGTKALFGDGTWAAPGMALATALPGSPTNGQLVALTDSLTAPTYVWPLRYNSTATKWQPYGAGWGLGTTLPTPAAGVDGVVFDLVDSTTNPTYRWRFIYNAGSANTDKWEFDGGSPQFHRIDTAEHSGASTSYLDLATVGPTLTVARAGIYEITFGAALQHFGGATSDTLYCSPKLGSAATADADAIVGAPNINGPIPGSRKIITTTRLSASDVVKLQYKTTDNSASKEVYAFNRWLAIRPVRVS